MIPFNKPYLTGKETQYIYESVLSGKISGNGFFTQKCHRFFEERYGFSKVLLTTSCTDALEMAAILINILPGDEVIVPSYTFVSTANAFILRGAKIVFADSEEKTPNIDTKKIENLVTPKTRAIVAVHYAGIACDMDPIMEVAQKYNLYVIEDSAMAFDSFYKGKPLASIGHLGVFSFHETKNVISGEGGMLVINRDQFLRRAEIIWEKGTNRAAFFRGEVDKYGWEDIGSSFLPSDIIAAFLFAQLEQSDEIQKRRKKIWQSYYDGLRPLQEKNLLRLPEIPGYATNNAHLFYFVMTSLEERNRMLSFLKRNDINAIFHYLPLHSSRFYKDKHDGRDLPMSHLFSDCLIRLPLFYEISNQQINYIIEKIKEFYYF
jgi:dTDP-4-amino-4,6-dideoxygalactose transaminase